MTRIPELPNLLDHHVSREDVASLIERLCKVRQEVYADWMGSCRGGRSHGGIRRALDDAIVLGLVAQYLRRRGIGKLDVRPDVWAQQGCVSQMASLAAGKAPQARYILSGRFFANKQPWPEHIRRHLFADGLPAAFRPFVGELPITILGDFHQTCLSNPLDGTRPGAERRAKGAHYTPPNLVDYMVARTLAAVQGDGIDPRRLHILDPSCGCGAFLIAILRHLARARGQRDVAVLSRCLYGSDIDGRAIDLARLSLLLTAWDISRRLPAGPPRWDRRLVEQDFLARPSWQNRSFDLILGGPPFIRVEQLHEIDSQRVNDYRRRYVTAQSGQFDLYMPFMEKSIYLLRPGGRLAFSVSSSFLRSKSGTLMRQFLDDNCRVEEIVGFEDGNVYPDAAVQIAILLIRKGGKTAKTRYVLVPSGPPVRQHLERLLRLSCKSVGGSRVLTVQLSQGGSDAWTLRSSRDTMFLNQLDAAGTPLADLPVRVSLGICTGADDVFILRIHRRSNGRLYLTTRHGYHAQIEPAALKPILRARRAGVPEGTYGHVCIFPYDARGTVLEEQSFQRKYPRAYRYVRAHKKRLASRRLCPGQPWFALRNADVVSHLAKPKLIAPTIFSPGGFRLDTEGVLCHHGLVTIAPLSKEIDPHYLLGVLNSSVLWRYMALRAARMGAGRRVLRLQLAKVLPVVLPRTARQRALAIQIARRVQQQAAPGCVDRLVTELYGLSDRTALGTGTRRRPSG